MQVSKSKFDSLGLKTFVYDFFKTKEFLWVKTPMGIKSLVTKKGEGKEKVIANVYEFCWKLEQQVASESAITIIRGFWIGQISYGNWSHLKFEFLVAYERVFILKSNKLVTITKI